jgi:hypothetical protein
VSAAAMLNATLERAPYRGGWRRATPGSLPCITLRWFTRPGAHSLDPSPLSPCRRRPTVPPTPSTKECLREDATTCFPPGHEWYEITHSGLDPMIERFIDTYIAFAHLPEELAYANNSL